MQIEVISTSYINTPVGSLRITGAANCIHSIKFMDTDIDEFISEVESHLQCIQQLSEYFDGKRKLFDFAFAQPGTDFQQRVWQGLLDIPYGETISYLELSRRLGDVKAIRAVGTSNGKNSIAIVVPCHRVIGSNNKLVGYAGGLWRKEWLLKHELNFSDVKEGMLF
jgi:methylated-DNA-[protein]-cysteine S-methyltransferase